MNSNLFENSWAKFPFVAVLEVLGNPVYCLYAQTEYIYCFQMYLSLYETIPNLFGDLD